MNKTPQRKRLRNLIDALCDVPFESDIVKPEANDTVPDLVIKPADAANMRAELVQFARGYANLDEPMTKPSSVKSSAPDAAGLDDPPPPRKM